MSRTDVDVSRARALESFDVLLDIDGIPAEIEANRRERLAEQQIEIESISGRRAARPLRERLRALRAG